MASAEWKTPEMTQTLEGILKAMTIQYARQYKNTTNYKYRQKLDLYHQRAIWHMSEGDEALVGRYVEMYKRIKR